jgi:hypothetical protein
MAIKTFTTGEVLTAADTNTYLANSGLVYISGTTTTAATIFLDGVFTSTYSNYLVTFSSTNTTATGTLNFRVRTSGTALTSQYRFGQTAYFYDTGTAFAYSGASAAGFPLAVTTASAYGSGTCTILNPALAQKTTMLSDGAADYTNYIGASSRGHVNNTATYDGIQVYQDSGGTITGTLRVYGIRQA